jgi:hypothetical protein
VSREAGARPALPRTCEQKTLPRSLRGAPLGRGRESVYAASQAPCLDCSWGAFRGEKGKRRCCDACPHPVRGGGAVSCLVSLSCASPPSPRLLRWPPSLRASPPRRRVCRSRAWACRSLALSAAREVPGALYVLRKTPRVVPCRLVPMRPWARSRLGGSGTSWAIRRNYDDPASASACAD